MNEEIKTRLLTTIFWELLSERANRQILDTRETYTEKSSGSHHMHLIANLFDSQNANSAVQLEIKYFQATIVVLHQMYVLTCVMLC